MSATSEDCPCCHECLSPGDDTDRALIAAFLGGHAASALAVPTSMALCAKHHEMALEAARFVAAGLAAGPRS